MKKLLKQLIPLLMIGLIFFESIIPAFANVTEKYTTTSNDTVQTEVTYTQESKFEVILPKLIDLGSDKTTKYFVSVSGDVSSDEVITVIPEKTFLMKNINIPVPKPDVEAVVTQNKTEWKFNEFETIGEGTVLAEKLTAGEWQGSFFFNIKLNNCNIRVTAKDEAGEDLNASATYIVGNEKDILLNSLVNEGFINSTDDVDALINVKSNDFDGIADTTFDVSDTYEEGDEIIILHFDETKQEWEYIGQETVDENGLIKGNFTSYSPVAFVKVTNNGEYLPISSVPGLYDVNGNLLCRWEDTGINASANYTSSTYKTNTASGYYIITNKYPTTTKIILPNNITTIGNYSFYGCNKIKELIFSDSIKTVGNRAFSHCTNLNMIKLNDGLTTIKEYGFEYCEALKHIYIPISVTTIESSAFGYCSSNETELKIYCEISSKPNGWTGYWNKHYPASKTTYTLIWNVKRMNYDGAVYHTNNITSFIIPEGVTAIPNYAFNGCANLKEVIIPSSVKSIGSYAFNGCTSLTNIELPNSLTSIGAYAFQSTTSLINIELPNTVTSLGSYAFYCSGIKTIKLSESLKTINTYTFYQCYNLTEIIIPNSVTSINERAFYYCKGLKNVKFSENLTTIGYMAFDGCSSLTKIELPDSVRTINDYAFRSCSSVSYIKLNDGLETIGTEAFRTSSQKLFSIYIPASVTTIKNIAFSYNSKDANNFKIYCEAISQPSGWVSGWSKYNASSSSYAITWGISRSDYEALIN